MIGKIEKRSLGIKVYESLKQSLLSEYQEGDLIPSENKLSKIFNVSRVVIREALLRLRTEKIIVTYQGKGSFLANPKNFEKNLNVCSKIDFEKYRQVMECREAIETFAVHLAVKNATGQELSYILECAERLATASNDREFNIRDYEFHLALVKCSHNDYFTAIYQDCFNEIFGVLELMNQIESSRDYAIKLHKEIAENLYLRNAKNVIKLLNKNDEYNVARIYELCNS